MLIKQHWRGNYVYSDSLLLQCFRTSVIPNKQQGVKHEMLTMSKWCTLCTSCHSAHLSFMSIYANAAKPSQQRIRTSGIFWFEGSFRYTKDHFPAQSVGYPVIEQSKWRMKKKKKLTALSNTSQKRNSNIGLGRLSQSPATMILCIPVCSHHVQQGGGIINTGKQMLRKRFSTPMPERI